MNNLYLMTLVIFSVLFVGCVSLPSKFDLRSIPILSKVLDYSIEQQGICLGQAWSQQIAQALSNAYSMNVGIKYKLSGRHILECITSITNKCTTAQIQHIKDAFKFIHDKGATAEYCIPNNVMNFPSQNCPRKCQDGYDFPIILRANVNALQKNNLDQILTTVGNAKSTVIVIYPITEQMNYYSAYKPQKGWSSNSQVYGYGVGEIVGWSNYVKGTSLQLTVKIGMGIQWGYKGYAKIDVYKYPNWINEVHEIKSIDEKILIE